MDLTALDETDSIFTVLGEVHYQTLAAERAFRAFEDACSRRVAASEVQTQIQAQGDIMFAIDAFVAPLGRLSSMLFPHPQKKRHKERAHARGQRLRKLLLIEDDHPIGSEAGLALRNDLMHIDERIDEAVERHANSWGPHAWLDSRHDDDPGLLATDRIMCCYFLESRSMTIFGQLRELSPLHSSVLDVRARLDAFLTAWRTEQQRRRQTMEL